MSKDLGKSSLGLDPNVAALLSYLGGFVSGIIIFVLEKDNKFVRFHAMQSLILFGALFVLQIALVFTIFLIVRKPKNSPTPAAASSALPIGSVNSWPVKSGLTSMKIPRRPIGIAPMT